MGKNIARVVKVVVVLIVAMSNAPFYNVYTATPSIETPFSASIRVTSCTCKQAMAIQHHNSFGRGKLISWEMDDWEFASNEKKDYYVFRTPPSIIEVEKAIGDL